LVKKVLEKLENLDLPKDTSGIHGELAKIKHEHRIDAIMNYENAFKELEVRGLQTPNRIGEWTSPEYSNSALTEHERKVL
jgi:hypothetical protein